MRCRSVSGASRELGVTPSAVSHALARLRKALNDELFVPGDAGMEPTARAFDLYPGIREGLTRISSTLNHRDFQPADAVRTFGVGASDYAAAIVLPSVIGRIMKAAPKINIRVFPDNRVDVVSHLDDGRIGLIVGWFGELPERMRRATLLVETEAVVVRPGHPLTQGELTKARLLSFPHVVVDMIGGDEEPAGGFYEDRGTERRVWIERLIMDSRALNDGSSARAAVTVPHYAAVVPLLETTDMVATLPRKLALRAAELGRIVLLDLPYTPLDVAIEAVWHERSERDAGAKWFVEQFIAASAVLASEVQS
jgi:DNA-binding transcriptional LysR family regulator